MEEARPRTTRAGRAGSTGRSDLGQTPGEGAARYKGLAVVISGAPWLPSASALSVRQQTERQMAAGGRESLRSSEQRVSGTLSIRGSRGLGGGVHSSHSSRGWDRRVALISFFPHTCSLAGAQTRGSRELFSRRSVVVYILNATPLVCRMCSLSSVFSRRSVGGKRDVVLWMDDGRRGEGGGLTRVSVAADWMFYADVRDVASSLESCHGSVWIAG